MKEEEEIKEEEEDEEETGKDGNGHRLCTALLKRLAQSRTLHRKQQEQGPVRA